MRKQIFMRSREIAKLVKSKTYKHEVMSSIPGTHELLYCFVFKPGLYHLQTVPY